MLKFQHYLSEPVSFREDSMVHIQEHCESDWSLFWKNRGWFSICWYTLQMTKPSTRSPRTSTQVQGPSTWFMVCCFPRCIRRELDWKQSCLRSNWALYEMLVTEGGFIFCITTLVAFPVFSVLPLLSPLPGAPLIGELWRCLASGSGCEDLVVIHLSPSTYWTNSSYFSFYSPYPAYLEAAEPTSSWYFGGFHSVDSTCSCSRVSSRIQCLWMY